MAYSTYGECLQTFVILSVPLTPLSDTSSALEPLSAIRGLAKGGWEITRIIPDVFRNKRAAQKGSGGSDSPTDVWGSFGWTSGVKNFSQTLRNLQEESSMLARTSGQESVDIHDPGKVQNNTVGKASCSLVRQEQGAQTQTSASGHLLGVGVFHVKGLGPKSSVFPSKPGDTNFWRDILGVLPGYPWGARKVWQKL